MGADFVIALKTAFAQICLTGIQRSQAPLAHMGRIHSEVYSAESCTPFKAALWFSVAPLLEGAHREQSRQPRIYEI